MVNTRNVNVYKTLDALYNRSKDMSGFYLKYGSTKYLMVCGLSKQHLDGILEDCSVLFHKRDILDKKRYLVFEWIDIGKIMDYLLQKKSFMDEVIIETLKPELRKVCAERCCVYQDDFTRNLNRVVRNPVITDIHTLEVYISELKEQLCSYTKWQWYNQKCSDLNENIVRKQRNIIQTEKQIPKVDFFAHMDCGFVFPFDLKTTIFPKQYYKKHNDIEGFLQDTDSQLHLLQWLYQEQNPRLFSNNYRYFIILLDVENPLESRSLKCDTDLIETGVSEYFRSIKKSDIIDIEYCYTKDKSLASTYKTKCMYTIISKRN
jgi:hypothetical protein